MHKKQKTYKNKAYLSHVRTFPCCVCGRPDTEAHHVRWSFNSGIGMKPGDVWAIPLCMDHHIEWHRKGMITFQRTHEVNIYEQLFMIAKSWIEKNAA